MPPPVNHAPKSLPLWNSFKQALKESIIETPIELIDKAWASKWDRTEFYFNLLLPKVCFRMKLDYQKEALFRVDAVFFDKTAKHGYPVPIVCIESENNADGTEREVIKLCSINAPLKVLFLCCEWSEKKKKELTDDYWIYILKSYCEVNQLVGFIGIIVAEWVDELKFHTFCFDTNANRIDDLEPLLVI